MDPVAEENGAYDKETLVSPVPIKVAGFGGAVVAAATRRTA